MDLSSLSCTRNESNHIRISADVGGDELWFDIPDDINIPETVADSFAIMALAPSMLRNEAVRVAPGYPISSTLVDNLAEVQRIFNCWNPVFRIVPIEAEIIEPSSGRDTEASMFSGGVDSLHTLMRHQDSIEEVILIGGFDMSVSREEMTAAQERNAELAEHLGARLRYVHTNQIAWGAKTGVSRRFWYSAYLAAAALLLRVSVVRIPSSHGYAALNPAGSHVILDPLWSNGGTQFVHSDIDTTRTQKMQALAQDRFILDRIQVCWDRATENCGQCGKCIRTMLTLNLLGYTGPFPRRLSTKEIRKIVVRDWEGVDFVMDNRRLALESGRGDVVRALDYCLRRYQRRKCLRRFDSGFLRGTARRLRRYWSEDVRDNPQWAGHVEDEV